MEVARFGGLDTEERPSPYEVAAEHRVYRLRHYYPSSGENEDRPLSVAPPTPRHLARAAVDARR